MVNPEVEKVEEKEVDKLVEDVKQQEEADESINIDEDELMGCLSESDKEPEDFLIE